MFNQMGFVMFISIISKKNTLWAWGFWLLLRISKRARNLAPKEHLHQLYRRKTEMMYWYCIEEKA